jgi:hypothetical protein
LNSMSKMVGRKRKNISLSIIGAQTHLKIEDKRSVHMWCITKITKRAIDLQECRDVVCNPVEDGRIVVVRGAGFGRQ